MLSFRLKTLRDYYRGESSIWDIGCDHGLLGLSFIHETKVIAINLVDPSSAVIDVLRKNIDSYITKPDLNVSIHHMKGQDVQLSTHDNLILIAGMGGSEIQEILTQLIPQLHENDRIVISPHRKIIELRQFLHDSDLFLEEERVIEESGQFYQILSLSLKGVTKTSLYGDNLWSSEVGEKYKNQQIAAFSYHQDESSKTFVQHLKSLKCRN